MKSNPEPKVTVEWQPVAGELAPAWRRLWARILQKKDSSSADNCNGPKGDEGEKEQS